MVIIYFKIHYFKIEARHMQDIFYKGYDLLVKVTFTSVIAYHNRVSFHREFKTEMKKIVCETRNKFNQKKEKYIIHIFYKYFIYI